jgi:hypothetical protein
VTDSNELTFRDFAGALMGADLDRASEVLSTLLAVDGDTARKATDFFQQQMQSGPEFMMKAMGMRQAVTEGSKEQLVELMGDCFDLRDEAGAAAADAVWQRYRS